MASTLADFGVDRLAAGNLGLAFRQVRMFNWLATGR